MCFYCVMSDINGRGFTLVPCSKVRSQIAAWSSYTVKEKGEKDIKIILRSSSVLIADEF